MSEIVRFNGVEYKISTPFFVFIISHFIDIQFIDQKIIIYSEISVESKVINEIIIRKIKLK